MPTARRPIEKSCQICIHREVCKFYHGEMSRRDYWGKDFIKELSKLGRQLAKGCKSYEEKK